MPRRSQTVDANRPIRISRWIYLLKDLSPRDQRTQVRKSIELEPEEIDTKESEYNTAEPESPPVFSLAPAQSNPGDTID